MWEKILFRLNMLLSYNVYTYLVKKGITCKMTIIRICSGLRLTISDAENKIE